MWKRFIYAAISLLTLLLVSPRQYALAADAKAKVNDQEVFVLDSDLELNDEGCEEGELCGMPPHDYGLGVGAEFAMLRGFNVYFDKNFPLDPDTNLRLQVHTVVSQLGQKESAADLADSLATKQERYGVMARLLWESGWYLGTGLLQQWTKLYREQSNAALLRERTLLAAIDIGWQGTNSYYFSLGMNHFYYLKHAKDYGDRLTATTPPEDQHAQQMWKDAVHPYNVSFMLGVGWYFKS